MDGREYSVLHETAAWVRGLTLDYTNQVLYWYDGDGYIYSSSVDGSNTTEVYYSYYIYSYNSLTIISEHLFWLSWNTVIQFNLKNGTFTTALQITSSCWGWTTPMVAVSKDRQPGGEI